VKRLGKLGVLLFILAFAVLLLIHGRDVQAQSTQNFSIASFTADYYLDRTDQNVSTMKVVEHIEALFPNYDQNHGILRAIPETYQDHTISLDVESVTDGQTSWHYSTSHSNGNLVLKIGDADRYVHGPQTYVVTYTMRNVISFLPDHQELYWDVNGDQWQQPFGNVTANIHIPSSLVSSLQNQQRCLVGGYGQTDDSRCTMARANKDGGLVVTAQASNLSASETMTYVLAFNKGTFVIGPEVAAARRREQIKHILIGAAIVGPPILAFLVMYPKWRRSGRDPKGRGVIIPEYMPPKGLGVLDSAFVYQESINGQAITAQVINLAIRRHITIYETVEKKILKDKKDYELELMSAPEERTPEEMQIITAFFGANAQPGSRIKISKLKNKLYTTASLLDKGLAKKLTDQDYFASNPKKAGSGYLVAGGALLILGFITIALLIGIGFILAGIVTMIFGALMPARSEKGVATRDYLKGLKQYINIAEKDRIKFLQSPEGAEKIQASGIDPRDSKQKVKLFEKLLPYAMLFGLEKQWAKEFQNIYDEPPDWYHGNWATFNAAYLATSLSGFGTASAASFSSPSSSSSSGFGGGGFSGGGGGGGGGGGW
jgi:uncharacterized membrane protein YgcG